MRKNGEKRGQKKRGQAPFPVVGVRPYHKECYKDESAGKYLFPMARPDPTRMSSLLQKSSLSPFILGMDADSGILLIDF